MYTSALSSKSSYKRMIYSLTPKPQNPIIIQKYYIYSNSNLILYYNSNSNLILYYNIYYINFIYYGFWGFENLVPRDWDNLCALSTEGG